MNTDKENTWRILQGLKPIQPLRCRFNFHRWTSFEIVENEFNDGYNPRYYARCHCADCGLPRVERPVILLGKKEK